MLYVHTHSNLEYHTGVSATMQTGEKGRHSQESHTARKLLMNKTGSHDARNRESTKEDRYNQRTTYTDTVCEC